MSHNYRNVTVDNATVYILDQTVRIERPSVTLSGNYTCKVATFFTEQRATKNIVIYGQFS